MLDNLQLTLPLISSLIRIIIFWWKKEANIPIMNMIVKDWITLKSDQERSMMIQRAQNARIISICSYCIMALAWFFITVLPIFGMSIRLTSNITDPGKLLPVQTRYIYDITRRPYYELTFISQVIYAGIAMIAYSGIDNFLSLLIFHVCGQLDILKNRLTHLNKYMNYHKMLKSCIANHNPYNNKWYTLNSETIEDLLLLMTRGSKSVYLTAGKVSPVTMTTFCSLIEKGNNISITHLTYEVCILVNTFGHMCVYCAVGEILMAQCNQIHNAVYNNKWYTLEPRSAKCLIVLLIRSNKSNYLTAGKVFPMTMATFCNLIKTSASYISVLLTTRT
ncbi:PREDICTED: odorant receptor Or2-like [Acromyrmex echinatior]|uniref:odorant receptor Or2-like n=1 Tax=Acromyrmex echinatior TaxID=103372 RepID=UPI000581076D|nr:PREDICTED: odorant receptor Or2-like [Acromyrmex echinatior]